MPNAKQPTTRTDTRQVILGIWVLYFFLQIITFARVYAINYYEGQQFVEYPMIIPISEMIRDRLVSFVVGLPFIALIVVITRSLLRHQRHSLGSVTLAHFVLVFPITYLWYVCFQQMALWMCTIFKDCQQTDEAMLYGYLVNSVAIIPVYLIAVAVTYTYYYIRRDNENQLEQSQLETKLLQARMKMLRSQLNPHFLFNTLNSVHSLIDINVEKAQTMVVDLADLLRQVLAGKDHQTVPLREELALLQRYVDIEKMRFSDDLTFAWRIDEQLLDARVPALLLQPLVENAIHHGFSPQHLHVHIQIEAQRQNGKLVIRVIDNGQGFDHQLQAHIFEQGTGLQNTRERLRTLYQNSFRFSVRNLQPGVCSEIELPITQITSTKPTVKVL